MSEIVAETLDATATATEWRRRAAFIQSLRACADWLEDHPTIRAPRYIDMDVFVDSREDVAAHARVATWEKIYAGQFFYLRKSFGEDLNLDIITARETVCRKVVTGTEIMPAQPEREVEIVEWVCDEGVLSRRPRHYLTLSRQPR